jgi:hypothetical protein
LRLSRKGDAFLTLNTQCPEYKSSLIARKFVTVFSFTNRGKAKLPEIFRWFSVSGMEYRQYFVIIAEGVMLFVGISYTQVTSYVKN